MEIILLQDVENLGHADSIVTVKPGYARNFLIPRGMAAVANPANRNALQSRLQAQESREARMLGEFQAMASQLQSKVLTIKTKAGTSGKIFGSITSVQVLAAIREAFGVEIERRKITLPEEVKMLGSYTANVDLSKQVKAVVNFEVVSEEAPAATAE
jgi:large subunit ribosomal protein L9